jgi:hypothetical protein
VIVRSIRCVHFAGAPDLHVRDLPDEGAVAPKLPAGADARVLVDALRFAFLGAPTGGAPAISAGSGHAYVEIGLRAGTDADVSVFRGVDRRGVVQTSIREEGGRSVAGGEEAVRARIEALVGAPFERWIGATWIGATSPGRSGDALEALFTSLARGGVSPAGRPRTTRTVVDDPAVRAVRARAQTSIESLRRAMRHDVLNGRIDAAYSELVAFGARLRRRRADEAKGAKRTDATRRLLEVLDEAIATFDAEAARASRALSLDSRAREPAEPPPADDEALRDARTRIGRLGDAVYGAVVERDALRAGGVASVEDAAATARSAFSALGEAVGEPEAIRRALDRAGLGGDVAALRKDPDRAADRLTEALAIGAAEVRGRDAGGAPAEALSLGEELGDLLRDVVGPVLGGRFVHVQTGARLELRLQGDGDADAAGPQGLAPHVRERLAFALRLRMADAALVGSRAAGAPRHVVVPEWPGAFADPDEVAAFVRSVAPRATQVFVAPPARPVRRAETPPAAVRPRPARARPA